MKIQIKLYKNAILLGIGLISCMVSISLLTFHANSAPVNYSVSYDVSAMCSNTPTETVSKGGCAVSEPVSQIVAGDTNITLPNYQGTRPGWTFAGWSTQNNPATLVDNTHNSKTQCPATLYDAGANVKITNDTVFYGCWIDQSAPDWPSEWQSIGTAPTGNVMPFDNLYWLRSPGYCTAKWNCAAATVIPRGDVQVEGQVVTNESISVRPAITVALDKISSSDKKVRVGNCLYQTNDKSNCVILDGNINGQNKTYAFDVIGINAPGFNPQGICESLANDGYADYNGGQCPGNAVVLLLSDSSPDKLDSYLSAHNGSFGARDDYNTYGTSYLYNAMNSAYSDLSSLTVSGTNLTLQNVTIPRVLKGSTVRNSSNPINTIYDANGADLPVNFYPLSSFEAKFLSDYSFGDLPTFEFTYRDKITVSVDNVSRTATINAERTCDIDTSCQVTQSTPIAKYITEYTDSYWLRTSDSTSDSGYSVSNRASIVGSSGFVGLSGWASDSPNTGVRPAMLIDLSSLRSLKPTLKPGYCIHPDDNTPSCVSFGDVSFDVIGVNDAGTLSGVCTLTDTSGYTAPASAECPNNTVMLLLSDTSILKPNDSAFRLGNYPYTQSDNNYGVSVDNSNEESDLKIAVDTFYNTVKGKVLANTNGKTLESMVINRSLKGGATPSQTALGENAGNSVLGGDVQNVKMYPLSALEASTVQKLGQISQIDYGVNSVYSGPRTSPKDQLTYRIAWSATPISTCNDGTALTDWTNDTTKGVGNLVAAVTLPTNGQYYWAVCAKDLAGNISSPRTGTFWVNPTDVVVRNIKVNDKPYDADTAGTIATIGQTAYLWERAGNPLRQGYDNVEVDFSNAVVKFENDMPSINQINPAISGKTRAVITGLTLKGVDASRYRLLEFEIMDGVLAANTGIQRGWESSAVITTDSPLLEPKATIDYESETLTGLLPKQTLQLKLENGQEVSVTSDSNGEVDIPNGWIPDANAAATSFSAKYVVSATKSSPEQLIVLPSRPDTPTVVVQNAHLPQNDDGSYQVLAPTGFDFEHRAGLSGAWSALGQNVNTKSGLSAGNYQVRVIASNTDQHFASKPAVITIDSIRSQLTLSGDFTIKTKVYDGNDGATLSSSLPSLSGLVGGWTNVSLDISNAIAKFSNKNAAIGKSVVVSGVTLKGADKANYELVVPDLPTTLQGMTADNKGYITTGNIEPKPVKVVIDDVIVTTSNAPRILDQHYTASGFIGNETFTQLSVVIVDHNCPGLNANGVAAGVGAYRDCVTEDTRSPFSVSTDYSLTIEKGTLFVRPLTISAVDPDDPNIGITITDPTGKIPGDSCLEVKSLNDANNKEFNALNDEISKDNLLHKAWDIKLVNCTTKALVDLDHYVDIIIANAEFKDNSTQIDAWHKHSTLAADKLSEDRFARNNNSLRISTNNFSIFGYSYAVNGQKGGNGGSGTNSGAGSSAGDKVGDNANGQDLPNGNSNLNLANTGSDMGSRLMLIALLFVLLLFVRNKNNTFES